MTDEQLCPEAPASASVRCQIEGFEWLITIRGFEMDGTAGRQLLGKIKAVNEKIKQMGGEPIYGKNSGQITAAAASEEYPEAKVCEIHNASMKRREKDGRFFYSHKLADGTWCHGVAK